MITTDHTAADDGTQANILILMGVSGSGKTTVGQALAAQLGWQFVDADDFHSAANVAKMQQGIPLTDRDRIPWLTTLHTAIKTWQAQQQSTVLACSALKADYRQRLAGELPLAWVYLEGPVDLLRSRLASRTDHFMPVELLRSQLDTLEVPTSALVVSIDQPPAAIVQTIVEHYGFNTESSGPHRH